MFTRTHKKCIRLCMSCNFISHTRHPNKRYDHAGRALSAERITLCTAVRREERFMSLMGTLPLESWADWGLLHKRHIKSELTLELLLFSIWNMQNLTTADACKWETTHKKTTSLVTQKLERPRTLQLKCAGCLALHYHWMQHANAPTICKTYL